MKANMKLRAVK